MFIAKDAPFIYRFLQRLLWAVAHVIARVDVTGFEHVPQTGALIVSCNHLHSLDIPAVGVVVPRWQAVFAADKYRAKLGGWFLDHVTRVIYVARGEADREATSKALAILRSGGALAVAPEGTRSRTGGLIPGKDGAVYLASRTGATIIPVAAWGQEHALGTWRRFKRPEIHIHIGEPIHLPPGAERARTGELHAYTDDLMLTLARMLPAEYRGVYADRVAATFSVAGEGPPS
jgi:1-acyl-sn-glycerol-3-phosphate acyltransferase